MQTHKKDIGSALLELYESDRCGWVVGLLRIDSVMYIHIQSIKSMYTYQLMHIIQSIFFCLIQFSKK